MGTHNGTHTDKTGIDYRRDVTGPEDRHSQHVQKTVQHRQRQVVTDQGSSYPATSSKSHTQTLQGNKGGWKNAVPTLNNYSLTAKSVKRRCSLDGGPQQNG